MPLLVAGAVGNVMLACAGDTTDPTSLSPARTYWALRLNVHAANLATVAPYDTLQLTATPHNMAGEALAGSGTVTYTTLDSSVTVSPTGLVRARYNTNRNGRTFVVASLRSPSLNLTNTDTVFIQVTDTAPHAGLATFSIQPLSGDSAKRALDLPLPSVLTWPVFATDSAGHTVCTATLADANYSPSCVLQVYFTSSDPTIATIDRNSGIVTQQRPGHVTFYATTWAYGVTRSDSVAFTVGYKVSYTIEITLAVVLGVLTLGFAAPKKLIFGVGAVVTFCNRAPQPVDVVFDNPTGADSVTCSFPLTNGPTLYGVNTGSGDILPFGGDTTATLHADSVDAACRRFKTPGVYRYHSTLFPSDTFEIEIRKD